MRARILVIENPRIEPALTAALLEEMEHCKMVEGISQVDIRSVGGIAARGNYREDEYKLAVESGFDVFVEVDGIARWTPGQLARSIVRVHKHNAVIGVWLNGEPLIRVRASNHGNRWLTPDMRVTAFVPTEKEVHPWNEREFVKWRTKKPRILCAVDVPDHCFARIGDRVKKRRKSDEVQVLSYNNTRGDCDFLIQFWWAEFLNTSEFIHAKKSAICIYDHFSWLNEVGANKLSEYAPLVDAIFVGSEKIKDGIAHLIGTTPVFLVEDGVDVDRFEPGPFPEEFTVGWCGNSRAGEHFGQEDLKGLSIIEEACKISGVKASIIDIAKDQKIDHDEMPDWYRSISVYACASTSEGTPNPVLEAMASGRPVISTDVGIVPKMAERGGCVIVDRDAKSFAKAFLKMKEDKDSVEEIGVLARKSAKQQSWGVVMTAWDRAIDAVMEGVKC